MDLVSIIVPVYNAEHYLNGCIESLLKQTHSELEIILINDGSTDGSLKICEFWKKKDSRIKLFSQPNSGQGAARNKGLAECSGNFIMFVDSDDEIDAQTVAKNVKILKDDIRLDFVQFPIFMSYGSADAYIRKQTPAIYQSVEKHILDYALQDNIISWIVCDKIFRWNSISDKSFRTDIKYEDNFFIIELLKNIGSFAISDQGTYYYYYRPSSTTASALSVQKENSTAEVLFYTLNLLKRENKKNLFYIYLIRFINVNKSLRVNFKTKFQNIWTFKNQIGIEFMFAKKLSISDKIKILFYRAGVIL